MRRDVWFIYQEYEVMPHLKFGLIRYFRFGRFMTYIIGRYCRGAVHERIHFRTT
jgi:hypothetical protein